MITPTIFFMCNKEMVVDVHQMSEPWNVKRCENVFIPIGQQSIYRLANSFRSISTTYGLKLKRDHTIFVD